MTTIAALQMGSSAEGTAATLTKILGFQSALAAARADLIVMPEALLGGYPKGETFGTYLGYRLPGGRERFAAYFDAAVALDGPELARLGELSSDLDADLVLGVIERAGSSLYCTAVFIRPGRGVVARHRKLMPTGTERLIWAQGDGSTMPVVDGKAGRLGAAICWENHMPLFRTAMYAKGVEIWCAPTVDARPIWRSSMRHIAHEGRCFVVSACQWQPAPDPATAPGWAPADPLIGGGSMIVGPLGDVLAGPLEAGEGLIAADIDLGSLAGARYDLDVVGHYARPDIFELSVDERPKAGVRRITDDPPH